MVYIQFSSRKYTQGQGGIEHLGLHVRVCATYFFRLISPECMDVL